MSFKKGLKNMLGFEDDDIYEDYEDEDYSQEEVAESRRGDAPEPMRNRERSGTSGRKNLQSVNPIRSLHGSEARISIVKPATFDAAKEICDEMKDRKIVVVNTTGMEGKSAQRLLDFISGAAYNSGGDVQEVETGVYVLSPPSVEVTRDKQAVTKHNFLDF